MAVIKPFKALRPKKNLVSKIISDNCNYLDLKEEKEHINSLISNGLLFQDKKECMYIYKLKKNGISQTGLVCCVSIDEYLNKNIIKHENVICEKENYIFNHIDYCKANINPIVLTYKKTTYDDISYIFNNLIKTKLPIYDFVTEDMTENIVWIIDDLKTINIIKKLFHNIKQLYIADGHHRMEANANICLKERKKNPYYDGKEEYNFFLSVIFPDDELNIISYDRIIKNFNDLKEKNFLAKVSKSFYIYKYSDDMPYKPQKKHTFGLYFRRYWYKLIVKEDIINKNDRVNDLDVSILNRNILIPILGINDNGNNDRIDFIEDSKCLKKIKENLYKDDDEIIIFLLYPISIKDIICVGNSNEVLPPKSTCFEPKPVNRLLMYKL